ncbi:MAG: putative ArsR family transcriptional regulator [Alteromonadaceae bacterium]|jgi:predicted ArsR family transcriptional regulator
MAKSISSDKILYLLKTRGPQTAQSLAGLLDMTSMGARQHLQALQHQELASTFDRVEKRGRPSRYWQLTEKAQSRFPDRHNDLTLHLIEAVQKVFGEPGLDKLIAERESHSLEIYAQALTGANTLLEKAQALAKIRTEEGYMVTVEAVDDGVWFYENHCPICEAASACQNFCRSELSIFSQILGEDVDVQRKEHIVDGARRCSYLLSRVSIA